MYPPLLFHSYGILSVVKYKKYKIFHMVNFTSTRRVNRPVSCIRSLCCLDHRRLSKVLGGSVAVSGIVLYVDLGHRILSICWLRGLGMLGMRCYVYVCTRAARLGDTKAHVIIVYIRRQSRLHRAVRGLVLTISVCEVPSVT